MCNITTFKILYKNTTINIRRYGGYIVVKELGERVNKIVDKSRRLIGYLYLLLALIKPDKLKLSNLVLLHPTIYTLYYRYLLLKRGRPMPTC